MDVSSLVEEIYRHNLWANLRLLDACAGLSEEQLTLSAPGTYGKVGDTLVHIFGAEARYVARLDDQPRPDFPSERDPWPGIAALRESAQRSGERLIQIAGATPGDRILGVTVNGGSYALNSVVPLSQAINHATEHRAHVVSILTQNGIKMPSLDVWAYGEEKGLEKQK
jgi:uncharacterized damage-inducible protein DinB